jgi:hypothetical protein
MEACASDKAMKNSMILSKRSEYDLLFPVKRLIDNENIKMPEVLSANE